MHLLNQSAFLKALGWALLNSFWQFGVLWLVFLLVTSTRKNLSAEIRHGLALFLLTIGFTWSGSVLCYEYFAYAESGNTGASINNGFGSSLLLPLRQLIESSLSYLSAIYLLVVAALFTKFFRYFYFSHKLQTQGLFKIRAELRMYVEQVTRQLDIKRKVNVWLSHYVDTPIIVGFLKPTILIPVACMNQLSTRQLEAILLHELAHIKRNDYLLNLFIAITEIVFFFNPFTALLVKLIKQERENSCDDHVLQFRFDRHQYASALLSLEKNRISYIPLSLASTGMGKRTLLHRIERILQVPKTAERSTGLKFTAYMVSVGLLCFIALFNPGDIVMKELVRETPPANKVFTASLENSVVISNNATENKVQQSPRVYPHTPRKEQKYEERFDFNLAEEVIEDNLMAINVAEIAINGFHQANNIVAAVKMEAREFSKEDMEPPTLPAAASIEVFPFVPSSSFSYVFVDTTKPKVKKESYNERSARETMIKARKAVAEINWEKIEKQLDSKVDVEKLKKEIEKCLQDINWQKINEEVKHDLAKETFDELKEIAKEAAAVNNYRTQQFQLQKLQKQLDEEKQLYKRNIEKQDQEIRRHLEEEKKAKRKKIVYI